MGLSLTELMVSTALLALAITGGLQAFTRAYDSRTDASITQQLHERAQYVFASLEPELQMAGYFGSMAAPAALRAGQIPDAARQCGESVVARLDLPVETLPAWTLPCAARAGGAATGSVVLILRRASGREASAPESGRAQWLSDISSPDSAQVYWQGDAPWSPHDRARGKELRELIVHLYYVARMSDGDADLPALRVKSLTSIAGVPAFVDTEVMPGVESLAVELSPSAQTPRTVRVTLRFRSDLPARSRDAPRTIEVSRHFTLRNVAA